MATQFEPHPSFTEQDERTEVKGELPSPAVERRRAPEMSPVAQRRIVRLVVASVPLVLTVAIFAIRLATSRGRQGASRRGRRTLVDVQPRVTISAPTIMFSLPLSGITVQTRRGRTWGRPSITLFRRLQRGMRIGQRGRNRGHRR